MWPRAPLCRPRGAIFGTSAHSAERRGRPLCERKMRVALLLLPTICVALEAKWTPASDGGPARFSKRYRDAQGIDDSRWTSEDPPSAEWSIFPTTPGGWALAFVAGAIIFVMLGQGAPQPQGNVAGFAAPGNVAQPATRREAGPAGEAARAAFLKKYG